MVDSSPYDVLSGIILREEKRILASFPRGAEKRWGLLELVRAIDHYFVYALRLDGEAREEEIQSERWDLFRYGQSKAVSLFMDESSISPGPSMARSEQEHQQWADSVIANCGRLGICEMMLNLHRYGLVELSMPSPKAIHATVGLQEVGVEALEANEFSIFGEIAREMDQQVRNQNTAIGPSVLELMSPLVSPWENHYIQYDTNPFIDQFFQDQGLLWARGHYEPGQDAFPSDATFGDLPFGLYREAVVAVIGFALKHIAFTSILQTRHPHLDIRNLLTVTAAEPRLLGYLSAALDITEIEARQVLNTLKLTPENIQAHASEPAVDIAPFLSINSSTVAVSIAGALSSPFDFMLAELYRRYRRDWDRAVDRREEYFREELNELFSAQRFAKAKEPLKLRNKGRVVTDIDAAIFDETTGTLGLFQLKWQDPFGTSMRKRNTKMTNFLEGTDQWVSTVNTILHEAPEILNHQIGDRTVRVQDTKIIHLFVIGRHFSRFSGESSRDNGAARGTWPQVLRLVRDSTEGSDPLTRLHKALQDQSPSLRTPVTSGGYETHIGEYRIVYDPVST